MDHDGDGRTCLGQQRMADEANRQLEGLGMAPLGSGNIEEDLRACVEAELTPDADDVRRGQGLGPNAGPLPDNLANPPPENELTDLFPPGELGHGHVARKRTMTFRNFELLSFSEQSTKPIKV